MKETINVSNANAKWFSAWKKRIVDEKPREGDYNFALFEGKDGVIYDPPLNNQEPSIYTDGQWKKLVTD